MKVEEIGTLEAKTHLSMLLNEVFNGKSFYLTRHGKRVAKLRPIQEAAKPLEAGFAKGTFTYISPNFDEPLDDFRAYMD